jgi:hypothetical protein
MYFYIIRIIMWGGDFSFVTGPGCISSLSGPVHEYYISSLKLLNSLQLNFVLWFTLKFEQISHQAYVFQINLSQLYKHIIRFDHQSVSRWVNWIVSRSFRRSVYRSASKLGIQSPRQSITKDLSTLQPISWAS